MNIIPHILAAVAALWLAEFGFNTLNEQALGFIGIGLFVWFMVMSIPAMLTDWRNIRGRGDHK